EFAGSELRTSSCRLRIISTEICVPVFAVGRRSATMTWAGSLERARSMASAPIFNVEANNVVDTASTQTEMTARFGLDRRPNYRTRMTRSSKTGAEMKRLFVPAIVCTLFSVTSLLGAEIKTPIRGLVSMGPMKFSVNGTDPVNTLEPLNAKPGIFGGIVILATWKELQKTASSGLTENNTIDKALEEVRAYNRKNPQKPLAAKLRVCAGFQALDWANEIAGT